LSFGQSRSLVFLPLVFASLLLISGCDLAKDLATDAARSAIGLGEEGGIDADLTAQIGKENNQNTALNTSIRPTIRGEGNTGVIRQDTSENKVENKEGGTVNINKTDPLIFGALIASFIVWSYFLYKLPSPDQIWKKKKNILQNTSD